MRKLILAVVLILAMATMAKAETLNLGDSLAKIPVLKQGIAFDFDKNELNYLSTMDVAKWKKFSLETGFSSKNKAVAVISLDLLNMNNVIKFPILDNLVFRPGVFAGYSRVNLGEGQGGGNNEFSWGLSCTFLDVKF